MFASSASKEPGAERYSLFGHSAICNFGISPAGIVEPASWCLRQTLKTKTYIREYRLFLKQLKQARLDAELTQSEVAKLLSRPQSFVSKSESGERRVDFIELTHLARIYRKPLHFFEVH
jgi:DNA-binding transcriptional regulator YiaG